MEDPPVHINPAGVPDLLLSASSVIEGYAPLKDLLIYNMFHFLCFCNDIHVL